MTFEHNVSIGNNGPGFFMSNSNWAEALKFGPLPSNTFTFRNNIAYANTQPALYVPGSNEWTIIAEHNDWSVPAAQAYVVVSMLNQYTAAQINAGAFGTGNMSTDPLFVNAGTAPPDVRLQVNSPCVDHGINVG